MNLKEAIASTAPTTNEGIATTRTAWFTTVVLYGITLYNSFVPDELDLDDKLATPIIVGAIMAFAYRLSTYLSSKYSWWGVVLFLINRAPGYKPPPPDDPVAEEVPPPNEPDRGAVSIDAAAVVAMIIFIFLIVALVAAYIDLLTFLVVVVVLLALAVLLRGRL